MPLNPAPETCNPVVPPEIPFEVPEPTKTFSELSIVIAVASELSDTPVSNKLLDLLLSILVLVLNNLNCSLIVFHHF
jgi:hypothetical protein